MQSLHSPKSEAHRIPVKIFRPSSKHPVLNTDATFLKSLLDISLPSTLPNPTLEGDLRHVCECLIYALLPWSGANTFCAHLRLNPCEILRWAESCEDFVYKLLSRDLFVSYAHATTSFHSKIINRQCFSEWGPAGQDSVVEEEFLRASP